MGEAAVRCRGVAREFGQGDTRVRVLHGIDLDVRAGELMMLVGPSGCGKTTLISIVAGILSASSGTVEVLGTELGRLGAGALVAFRRANLGFIFQQYNLLPALSAAENASVSLLAARRPRAPSVRAAREMLDRLGMGAHADKLPAQLSGGQQQRVAIARALVHGPRLVVCDEPTAALDAAAGQTVMGLLREVALRPDCAVVVVTHDSRIFHFADRIARMEDGRVLGVERPGAPGGDPHTPGDPA